MRVPSPAARTTAASGRDSGIEARPTISSRLFQQPWRATLLAASGVFSAQSQVRVRFVGRHAVAMGLAIALSGCELLFGRRPPPVAPAPVAALADDDDHLEWAKDE